MAAFTNETEMFGIGMTTRELFTILLSVSWTSGSNTSVQGVHHLRHV